MQRWMHQLLLLLHNFQHHLHHSHIRINIFFDTGNYVNLFMNSVRINPLKPGNFVL